MKDPEFLDLEDVLLIHARQLAEHGGQAGIAERRMDKAGLAAAFRQLTATP